MSVAKEFREFALKGSVIDLAIGVVVGAAFGRIVESLVADVVMPPIGLLTGGIDFANKFITLRGPEMDTLEKAKEAGAVTLNYGAFINVVFAFTIIAIVMFFIMKRVVALRKKEEVVVVVPAVKACGECLSDVPKEARRCRYCGERFAAA
jgi:large conductance mechanosensitive channel